MAARIAHLPHRCPVCWQKVRSTSTGNIAMHWDSIGKEVCPGDALPYSSTIVGRRPVLTEAVAS